MAGMRKIIRYFVFLAVMAIPVFAAASIEVPDQARCRSEIDLLLQEAISHRLIAGGVALVGDSREDIFCKAYGRMSGSPDARPLDEGAVFDLASLTKVVATTPALMKLVEEGQVSLIDPVCKWFPEFAGKGKDDLLVLHLLTHTSGLRDICPSAIDTIRNMIEKAASLPLKDRPGSRFHYADINFILLGELVGRASHSRLDIYAAEKVFIPLNMLDTCFNPDRRESVRCAATLNSDNSLLFGRVQDSTAYQLGGVAGHAGLFSTAHDLSLFCRMLLNNGILNDERIFSEKTMEQMTIPYFFQDGKIKRGLGWDMESPFSSPRGEVFSEQSFGHTGYSGCSIWVDPKSDVFVVLLTARLDYKRIREFNQLRSHLSTAAAHLAAVSREMRIFARKFE